MKINVATSLKGDEIRKMLESQNSPKYTYLGMLSKIEMQFEVEDDGTHGNLCSHTKRLIYALPYGKVIVFRVLFDGQLFDGGKIYQPGDPEYIATHAHQQF